MNSDQDRLLNDILAEPGETGEPRDALLDRTLRQVRRRRTVRRVRRTGVGVAVLLLPVITLLLWRVHLPRGPEIISSHAPYVVVRTAPLPLAAVLETRPFASSEMVASVPSLHLARIATRPEERQYREIDDDTLLALAGTNAVVLVRLGPHSAELVFASGTVMAHTAD